MRRLITTGAAVVLGGFGFVALAPHADADPAVCISLSLNLNGTPVEQAVCLPPDDAPGVPEAPELPALPPLPV